MGGSSTSCFRSRLPPPELTRREMTSLSLKSDLTVEEIEDWYSRFVHCYPYGYLSENDFIYYYQEFLDESSEQLKPLIKDFFQLFDLNGDKKLDFQEFLLFNVLTNNGSNYEKILLIFRLFDHRKEKSFSRNEIRDLLRNLFDLLHIPSTKLHLTHIIDTIFHRNHLSKDQQIPWKLFTEQILDDQSLLEQLISADQDNSSSPSFSFRPIQRSERF